MTWSTFHEFGFAVQRARVGQYVIEVWLHSEGRWFWSVHRAFAADMDTGGEELTEAAAKSAAQARVFVLNQD